MAMILTQLLGEGREVDVPSLYSGSLYNLVFLAALLALLAGIVYLLRRNGNNWSLRPKGDLKLLESRSLGGRQFLVVAAYHNQRFLLGVCPGRIDYLCSVDSYEATGEPAGDPASAAQPSFSTEEPLR